MDDPAQPESDAPPVYAPTDRRRLSAVGILAGAYLVMQASLPALGSAGLIIHYGREIVGKLLMTGWLPILVYLNVDFAFYRPPKTTAGALVLLLAVPLELAVAHLIFNDYPALFFADLFLVEVAGVMGGLVVSGVMTVAAELREGFAALAPLVVITLIGAPLLYWLGLPFWLGREDHPLWLAVLGLTIATNVALRAASIAGGPASGDSFAAPWMLRGFLLWIVALVAAVCALQVLH